MLVLSLELASGAYSCNIIIIIIICLFTAIGLLLGGSGYFTCKQNMKLITTKFKSGGLHEKRVMRWLLHFWKMFAPLS